jgi:nitroreductase
MDVFDVIKARRSIRIYSSKSIPEQQLQTICEAARLAPSAANRQPWRFIIVQDSDRKRALAEAADNQTFLSDAAAIVVAIGDPDASANWCEKYTMIAMEHIVLTATSLGYGTCWIGAFDADTVKRLLKIPAKMKVVAITPIGTPNEKPAAKPRKPVSDIFFREEWKNS